MLFPLKHYITEEVKTIVSKLHIARDLTDEYEDRGKIKAYLDILRKIEEIEQNKFE